MKHSLRGVTGGAGTPEFIPGL